MLRGTDFYLLCCLHCCAPCLWCLLNLGVWDIVLDCILFLMLVWFGIWLKLISPPRFPHNLNVQGSRQSIKIQPFFPRWGFFCLYNLKLSLWNLQILAMGKCSLWSVCELFKVTVIQQVFHFLTQKKQQMIVIVSLLHSLQNAAYRQS